MGIINWNDSLSVGVQEIDAQHKQLIKNINDLFDAMKAGKANEILGKILADLAAYTKFHFSTEEKYMQKFNYAEYAQHKAEHEDLTRKVLDFQDKFSKKQITLSLDLMNFLKEWLTKHITGTDKKYRDCFNQNGLN